MDIRTTAAPLETLSKAQAKLGESPSWSQFHKTVWWVDIVGKKLFRTDLSGDTQEWATPEIPGFVQSIGEDVFVGMQTGIFRFDQNTELFEKRVSLLVPRQRFNDACTDNQGRIWAGTMDIDNQRANGTLYLFDPKYRTLLSKFDGFRTINGLAWDQSRSRLFFSDSHPDVQTVWTSNIKPNGQMAKRETFVNFESLDGRPDGATLDAHNNYWVAAVGGASVYRFNPDGNTCTKYEVPLESPTKPTFIEDEYTRMVLTSFEDSEDGGRLCLFQPDLA